jgi:hypothetical protein
MSLEVIQVEVVGQSWLSAALPVLAIVISLGSLGDTLWFRFRDDARLRLRAVRGYLFGAGQDDKMFLYLEATNQGRSGATVLQSLRLVLADGSALSSINPTVRDTQFPATLAPGKKAQVLMLMSEVPPISVPRWTVRRSCT